jgi:hypothetical protein
VSAAPLSPDFPDRHNICINEASFDCMITGLS